MHRAKNAKTPRRQEEKTREFYVRVKTTCVNQLAITPYFSFFCPKNRP